MRAPTVSALTVLTVDSYATLTSWRIEMEMVGSNASAVISTGASMAQPES